MLLAKGAKASAKAKKKCRKSWPAGLCATRYRCSTGGRASPRGSSTGAGGERATPLVARHQPEAGWANCEISIYAAQPAWQTPHTKSKPESARARISSSLALPAALEAQRCQPAACGVDVVLHVSRSKSVRCGTRPVRAQCACRSPPGLVQPGACRGRRHEIAPERAVSSRVLRIGRGHVGEEEQRCAAARDTARDATAMGVPGQHGIDDAACLFDRQPVRAGDVQPGASGSTLPRSKSPQSPP